MYIKSVHVTDIIQDKYIYVMYILNKTSVNKKNAKCLMLAIEVYFL